MKYLLDTNAVIALLKNSSPALASNVRACSPGDIGLSSIVMHELYFGAFKSQRAQSNLEILDRLNFEVLPFGVEDAREAGRVRAELAGLGTPIGPYDALIAGQAAERQLILITRNGKEFSRVKDLRWEDWES